LSEMESNAAPNNNNNNNKPIVTHPHLTEHAGCIRGSWQTAHTTAVVMEVSFVIRPDFSSSDEPVVVDATVSVVGSSVWSFL